MLGLDAIALFILGSYLIGQATSPGIGWGIGCICAGTYLMTAKIEKRS